MDNHNIRVLFVDDEIELAQLICKRLERKGFKVSFAHDASNAMQILTESTFDVVVSDINMPGASGFDFLELSTMTYGLPVILISGNIDQLELDSQGQIKGAFASLAKPFQYEDLEEYILKAAAYSEQLQPSENSEVAEQKPDQPISSEPYRILVVEDEEILRDMLSQVLSNKLKDKVSVTIAKNGLEASQEIEKGVFDCIITDLEMPKMNGSEFLKKVIADEHFQDTKVIVVSAYSHMEVPEMNNLIRFDKPVSANEIVKIIEGYVADL